MDFENGSKSFSLAARILPQAIRKDVERLYLWCRYCDDLIDIDLGKSRVKRVESLMQLTSESNPPVSDPVFAGLAMLKQKYAIPEFLFKDFLAGMKMDEQHEGFGTLAELEIYAHRVAGVVGLMMSPLLGVRTEKAGVYAAALGKAMQLTNICRDVREDAALGRVYLPREFLGHPPAEKKWEQVLLQRPELGYSAAIKLQVRAEELYRLGREGLKFMPFRSAFCIGAAACFYREIGRQQLKRARSDQEVAFRKRTVVGRWQKLKCIFFGLGWAIESRMNLRIGFLRRAGRERAKI